MRRIVFGVMLAGLPTVAIAQCNLGDIQEVTVPCITGWMTFPPRTEECALSPRPGWVLHHAAIGERSLGGTGGVISIIPTSPISQERRIGIGQVILNEMRASNSTQDNIRTAQLASLLQSIATGAIPLHQSEGVHVSITLYSTPGVPFCSPGATTNHCPHARVLPIMVGLICLPSSMLQGQTSRREANE